MSAINETALDAATKEAARKRIGIKAEDAGKHDLAAVATPHDRATARAIVEAYLSASLEPTPWER